MSTQVIGLRLTQGMRLHTSSGCGERRAAPARVRLVLVTIVKGLLPHPCLSP
jgi:hypothetical protein